jgi:hypothetical protein
VEGQGQGQRLTRRRSQPRQADRQAVIAADLLTRPAPTHKAAATAHQMTSRAVPVASRLTNDPVAVASPAQTKE